MPLTFKRKIIQVGSSLGVTIPADIINSYNLKKGDWINILSDAVDREGFITIDLRGRDKKELWRILNDEES